MFPNIHIIRITNLPQEREKFFSDQKYNPQFIYTKPINQTVLTKYGRPREELYEFSGYLIRKFLTDFGQFSEVPSYEGKPLTLDQTNEKIDKYLEINNLERKVRIVYIDHMVARTAVGIGKDGCCLLKIRRPISYRDRSLEAVLDHEIGTHIFRMVNEMRQTWYVNNVREHFSDYIETEEGLATLHLLMTYPIKIPIFQATYYYAVFLAQKLSFAELFAELSRVIDDPELVWFFTVRVKRGLMDTSLPGGYTKDIVYLSGARNVAAWLAARDFDSSDLYFGKIALRDVENCLNLNPRPPKLPHFIGEPRYQEVLARIVETSGLQSIQKRRVQDSNL